MIGVLITLALALALGALVYFVGKWRKRGSAEPPSEPAVDTPDS